MSVDGYSSQWEQSEQSDFPSAGTATVSLVQRPPLNPLNTDDSSGSMSRSRRFIDSPQPRMSSDSASGSSPFRDTAKLQTETQETPTVVGSEGHGLVEATFDENILRSLCDLDGSVPLLLDRIKQSMVSCREASVFFKKRAVIEEEYGKALQKLARTTWETYTMNDGKSGTFVVAWQSSMKIHENMAENRLRFAQRLNEMSEELANLAKEVDKNRKQTKDLATRYERALQESELVTEKSKNRLDLTSEELERVLLQKEGESFKDNAVQARVGGASGKRAIGKAVAKGGLLLKGKNPGNIQRQEDDVRARMSSASDAFRKAVVDTQGMRQEYFNFQLPRILRALKECADEVDLGTQYHLTRYAFLFESIVLNDGSTLVPPKDEVATRGGGLKHAIETIDNRGDFKTFMQNYAYARGNITPRGPRRDGPSDEGFLPPIPVPLQHDKGAGNLTNGHSHQPQTTPERERVAERSMPTFGIDLAVQMNRDDVEVPLIMKKCCEAIEKYGMDSQGIYRLSGTATKIQALKQRLDKDFDSVEIDAAEDINNVTGVLKMWLRELPDPLMTFHLQASFIEAAKNENERLRHIRLHERVNELPDANYATLKYFLGHLHRINQNASVNSMTMQNLGIVFGPTLFGQLIPAPGVSQLNGMADASFTNQAIETILNYYNEIFVEDGETEAESGTGTGAGAGPGV